MLATVTDCPFLDTERLSSHAEQGMAAIEPVIKELLSNITHAGLNSQATQLDDAFLAAVTAVQNETVRKTICPYCDTNQQCHPGQQ